MGIRDWGLGYGVQVTGLLGPQKMPVLPQPTAVESVIGDDQGNAAPETGGMVPFHQMG